MSEGRVTLSVNAPAPLFDLVDIFGRRIKLSEYRGKKVLVAFFRHAGCPFCNTRVHALQEKEEVFKAKGLEMIFFFESGEELLRSSQFHKKVSPIPLISDPAKVWYDAYGVEKSGAKSARSHLTTFFGALIEAKKKNLPVHWMQDGESIKTIPAEFLVDEKGFVKQLYYARGLRDRMSMEQIEGFIKTNL